MDHSHSKKEVEIKIRIDSLSEIERKLKNEGAIFIRKTEETDIYYSSLHKDFIATKECLRIRTSEFGSEITHKPPSSKGMEDRGQYWKKETNLSIETEHVNQARSLLKSLGFIEVVLVIKKRKIFSLDQFTITVDSVIDGGNFMEVEQISDDKDRAIQQNLALIKKIGYNLNHIEVKPYRDIVLSRKEIE